MTVGVIMDYTCLVSPSFDHIAYMLCSLLYHHHLSLFHVLSPILRLSESYSQYIVILGITILGICLALTSACLASTPIYLDFPQFMQLTLTNHHPTLAYMLSHQYLTTSISPESYTWLNSVASS